MQLFRQIVSAGKKNQKGVNIYSQETYIFNKTTPVYSRYYQVFKSVKEDLLQGKFVLNFSFL